MLRRLLFILTFFGCILFQNNDVRAQLAVCDPGVPFFFVDLSGNADSVWESPAIKRNDQCCGVSSPDRCISFTLLLDSNAQGFKFDIASGAKPSGALFYQIDCGPIFQVGDPICLPGPGPYDITFCKPGANLNTYGITSIAKPEASPPTVVSDGCSAVIWALNYIESTLTWTSIPFNATHNSYMDCTSGCDTVNVRIDSADSPPPFIDYQVSGVPEGGCDGDTVTLTIRVFFVSDKFVEILPKDPVICFGGSVASVTANPNGGAAPYTYLWSTGETTQSINVGVGTYTVQMLDSTDCPPVYDTVTVTANPSPISVEAGPPLQSCVNNTPIQLQGSVVIATGGKWTGGSGTYAPNDSTLNAVYTPTAGEVTAGSVTLTLTTTGNGTCPPVNDQTTIFYNPSPIVNAGGPYTSCSNNPQVVLAGTVTNAGGGRWTGGAGTFSPHDSALNATYIPTQTEINNGSLILTLTSIQNGTCNPEISTATVNFTPGPTAFAGNDDTVCANNVIADLTGGSFTVAGNILWSGGTGTFSPDATTLNASYTPSAAEITAGTVTLTLTTTNNGSCLPASDQKTIVITPAPVVFAGNDIIVCANNRPATLAGTVTNATGGTWTSSGTGTFTPDANTLGAVYTPSDADTTAGTVTLTLTSTGNGNCLPVSDQVIINITPAPTVEAGTGSIICGNNPSINLTGSVSTATGGTWSGGAGAFAPSPNNLNAIYTPTSGEITSGSVTLTLTSTGNGSCLAVTDNVTYTFDPAPTVDAGTPISICSADGAVSLNGSFTNAANIVWTGGSGTFSPNNTTPTANYTPSAAEITAGTATLTITTTGNGNCNAVTDQVTITITPSPSVAAGNDQIICSTLPEATLAGVVNNATAGIWSGGNGTFTPSNTDLNAVYRPTAAEITAGVVNLILTSTGNNGCNADADTVAITIIPGPNASAGNDQFECKNNVSIALNGVVTNATGGQWFGQGSFLPNSSTVNATYVPTPGELASNISALIFETTGNGVCPADRDTLLIIFTPSPIAAAGLDDTVCANNLIATVSGTVTNATSNTWSGGNGTYAPSNTSLNVSYTPTAAEVTNGFANLILTAGRAGCLSVTDTMRVLINPTPIVEAGNSPTVCANNANVSLNGSVLNATGGLWTSSGSGTFSPNASALNATYTPSAADTAAGSVTLTLTSTGNGTCNPVSDVMTITITPAPTVDAGNPITICANNANAVLNGTVSTATGGTWTGGSGTFSPNRNVLNPTYVPSAAEITAGSVTLTLNSTGNGNCNPVSDNLTITITIAPTVEAGPPQTVCADNPSVVLDGSVTTSTGGQWTGGNGTFSPDANTLNATYTPSATEITNGTVTLTLVSTGNGNCNPVSDVVTFTITEAPVVTAGANQDVCGDLSPVTLNGNVIRATGGTWTTAGSGTFAPDANTLNAVYTPSSADTAAGSVTLTLTSTGNNGCNARSASMTINFISAPTVNAGPAQVVCSTDMPIQLNGSGSQSVWSGGNGSFSPSVNTLDALYQPTPAEITAGSVTLTLSTVANAFCPSISSNVTISIPAGPNVFAGDDTTVCGFNASLKVSGQVTNAGGGTWTSSGTGTFANPNAVSTNYTFSTQDRMNGSVLLILSSTGNGSCLVQRDSIAVQILEEIVSVAGPDITACADASGIPLIGNISGASGGIWTTSGSGTFSPSNTDLNASYVPSNADTTAGTVTLTLTSTGNGTCPADASSLILTITPAPTVFAGNNSTICADAGTFALNGIVSVATGGQWSTTGSGSFSPNASALTTNYIPSNADTTAGLVNLILTSTGNGTCNAVDDTLVLNILPVPVVTAGQDQIICADDLSVSLNGNVSHATSGNWTTSGSGSFVPDANTLNATYNLSSQDSAAGLITLTLTSNGNGTCNPVTDQTLINITPAPTVDAGNDLIVCANTASVGLTGIVTIASGGIWTTSGSGTFNPSNTNLNAAYVPSSTDTANGSVTITLTSTGNGTCNPVAESIVITFQDIPTVSAGNDTTICGDQNVVPLNGSFSNATGLVWSSNGTGSFSPNSTDPSTAYNFSSADSAAGNVVVTVTSTGNGACPADVDTKILNITPGVVVSAGNDFTVCADTLAIQLNGAVNNATGGIWSSTGTGTFNPDNTTLITSYIPSAFDTAAGQVSFTLTSTGNGGCLAQTANVQVTILPAPYIFAGPDVSLCAGDGGLTLNAQISNAGGGIWSTFGSGAFSPNNTDLNGTYLFSPNDTANGQVSLLLQSTNNGICKSVDDTINIIFEPIPTVFAGNDISICLDATSIPLNGTIANATGSTWSSSGTGTFTPNANTLAASYVPSAADKTAGNVVLNLTTNGSGSCPPVTDDVNVTYTPVPTVFAGLDDTLCISSPVINLNGTIGIATGGTWTTASGQGTFSPSNASLNATFTPSATQLNTGSVILTLTTTGNGTCNSRSDQKIVKFQDLPNVFAGPDNTVCADNPGINLNGTLSNAGGVIWTTAGSGTFSPRADTLQTSYQYSNADQLNGSVNVFLESTNNGACPADRDTIGLIITPAPTVVASSSANCADENGVTLTGVVTIASGLSWSSSGTGNFIPNTTNNVVDFIPSAADIAFGSVTIYLTSTGNGNCNAVVDSSIVLILNAEASVEAGSNKLICADQNSVSVSGSITNAASAIWSSNGGGTFTPSANALNAQYTPTALDKSLGTVKLFLTTNDPAICTQVYDSLILTITPRPTIEAGNNQTICANRDTVNVVATTTIASGVTWSTKGSGTFTTLPNKAAQYYPSAADKTAGSVYLLATSTGNGLCNPVKDSLLVTLTPATAVSAGQDLFVCDDVDSVFLSRALTVATSAIWTTTGTGTISPSTSSSPILYVLTSADKLNGSVSLFSTTTGNGSCFAAKDTVNIFIAPEPQANITLPNLCTADDSIPMIGDTLNSASFYWSTNGTGSFTPDTTSLNVNYIRSALDSINGTATIYLIAVGDSSCTNAIDSVVLNLSPPPAAFAGNDQVVCADTAGINLSGTINNATSGLWTSSGTGNFTPNATDLLASYVPSAQDTANGSVVILLTTQGNGACDADVDTMNINITPAPTVDAGPAIVCTNNPTTTLNGTITTATGAVWTTAGDGTFDDTLSLNPTYTIGTNDGTNGFVTLTLTTTGNGSCKAYSDQIVVNVASAPLALAGNDTTICGDRTIVQLNGSQINAGGGQWSTPSNGTFDDATLLNATYNITAQDIANDSVIFILQTTGNGTCLPDFDTVVVFFGPIPTVSAGPGTVCSNNATLNLNGVVTIATGGFWSNPGSTGTFGNANNPITTYTPSAGDITNGSVMLILTTTGNNGCNAYADTINLFITPGPDPEAGPAQSVCADTSFIQLNGVVNGALGGIWTTSGTGTFDDSTLLNAQYQASAGDTAAGQVTFYLTTTGNGNCLAVTDSVVVTITPAPILSISSDQTVCADTAGVDITSTIANAGNILWTTTGTGSFTPNNTQLNTKYIPSLTDTTNGFVQLIATTTNIGNCKAVRDTIDLTITPAPTLDPGPSPVCSDNPVLPLDAIFTVATGVQWSTSGTGVFAPNDQSATGSYLRSTADSSNGAVTLYVQTTGNGSCKPVYDSVVINLLPAPAAQVSSDVTICDAQTTVNISGSVQNATGGLWSGNGAGSFDDNTAFSTFYTVDPSDVIDTFVTIYLTSTGNGSCQPAVDSLLLTITSPSPQAIAGNDLTVCSDVSSIQLNGSVVAASSGTWTTNGTGFFSPNANALNAQYFRSAADTVAGNVRFVLTTTGNGICNPDKDTINLTFTNAPSIDAGGPIDICEDSPIANLNANAGGNAVFWTTSGSGTFDDSTLFNAVYTASASDIIDSVITLTLSTTGAGGCQVVTDQTEIYINPGATVDPGFDQTICADEQTVNLAGAITFASGATWTTSGSGTFGNDTILNTIYSPSLADTTAGSVFLTLTTFGEGAGCISKQDSILLTINDGVLISAGGDLTECVNTLSVALSGSVTNALNGQWTSTGTGAFAPSATGTSSSYFITPADRTQDSLLFFFTSTGNGGCLPKQDTSILFFVPNPIATAGNDITVCADNPDVNLNGSVTVTGKGRWSSSGSGIFSPNDSSLTATYQPSATDITNGGVNLRLVSIDNGDCSEDDDFVSITILPAPVIDAGQGALLCFSTPSATLQGSKSNINKILWTSSGNGTFTDSTQLNAIYIFSANDKANGSVTLTLSSNDVNQCNPISSNVVFNFRPEPTVSVGSNITVCGDVTSVQLTGTFANAPSAQWSTTGSGSFTPNSNVLTPVYLIDSTDVSNGSVGFTLTTDNAVCPSVSSALVLNITPIPTISVGQDMLVCETEDSVVLNAQITIASGAQWTTSGSGFFIPSANVTNPIYIPSAADVLATTISLTATTTGNGTCIPKTDQLLVTFKDNPEAIAGPGQLVCADVNGVSLNGTILNASGGFWTTSGTGAFTPDPSSLVASYVPSATDTTNGNVVLTLTSTGNDGCPASSGNLNLGFQPLAIVSTGNVDACADQSGILLNGQVSNAPGVNWTTSGSGIFTPSASALSPLYVPSQADFQTGLVTLTISSSGSGVCQERSDDANVIITPLPPANAGEDQTICRNTTTTLVPLIENGNSYSWYTLNNILIGQQGLQDITASSDTAFILGVRDVNGCEQFDTVNISVIDPPVLNLPDQFCFQPSLLLSSNPTNVPPFGTFQWFKEDSLMAQQNNEDITVVEDGTYILLYNFEGCNVSDTTTVTPLPLLEGPDVYACQDDSALVITNNYPKAIYEWSLEGNPILSDTNFVGGKATDSLIYQVRVTDSLNCVNRDTIMLIPVPPPIIELDDNPACVGDVVFLNARPLNVIDTLKSEYQWYQDTTLLVGDTLETLLLLEGGTYRVEYALGGCRTEASATVSFNLPAIPDNIDATQYCNQIDPFIALDAGPGGIEYFWYDNEDTTQISEQEGYGYFKFDIINEFGCIATDSINVIENCPPQLFVPNAFSPNGDGLDDIFLLFGKNFKDLNFKIFNRWGEVIFLTESKEEGWDGNYRGKPMPIGVYPWTAEYKGTFPGQEGPFKLNGKVTVIR